MMAASSSVCKSEELPACAMLLTPGGSDFGMQSSARREFAGDGGAHWLRGRHDIAQKPVHYVFIKDAEVAVGEHVHLERFQLQAQFVGRVAQRKLAEIG